MSELKTARVLVADPIHDDGIDLLQRYTAVDFAPPTGYSAAELAAAIPSYEGLVVRSRTAVPTTVINQAARLRVIGRAGVGLDGIDVATARARRIRVVNAPDASTVSVAEHALALILALARRITQADRSVKAGQWAKQELGGVTLNGRTLGIIGFGRIGRQVARLAKAAGMRVLVNQPRLTPELVVAWQVEAWDLLDLLPEVDFLTLHVPLRPETEGMIEAEHLALLKPTAYVVNTARGGVVDEEALLAALEAGRLAGAGLDVFQGEPQVNRALVTHPRVIATPHIAASTEDAQRQAAVTVAEQIVALLR